MTETIDHIAHAQPQAIARLNYNVPAALEVVVRKALRKDRDERYQTVRDLLLDLKELKRDTDLASSLEHSTPLPSTSGQTATETMSRSVISATSIPALLTTPVATPHATSSAEYIAGEIKRHRPAVIAGVAIFSIGFLGIIGAAIGLYRYYSRPAVASRRAGKLPNLKLTRLTANGKTENAAISPDGKTVVYVLRDGMKKSLWIRQVATSTNIPIVPPSETDIGRETFSPDGTYVYYQAFPKDNPQGVLFQVSALGGVPRKILSNIASPIGFSPDGTRIAFIRDDEAATGEDHLIVANADGSNEKKLAFHKTDSFFPPSGVSWSPDGKLIGCPFGTYAGGFHVTVVTVDSQTGEQKEITDKKFGEIGRVSWLSDGSGMLVNAAEIGTTQSQIWLIPYPAGEAQTITHDLNDYGGTSLTADSRSLVTVGFDVTSNIWVAPGNDLMHGKQITSAKMEGANGLAWTPDGRIVYSSQAGGNSDLWIMNEDGTNQKQLTSDPAIESDPLVTPDGRYIFFNSLRGGLPSIWRVDIDGNNLKQVTDQEDYLQDITRDGKSIIFVSWRTSKLSLWRVSVDGAQAVQISNLFIGSGRISPDGKSIACRYRDENSRSLKIIILPIEGGAPTKSFDFPPTAAAGGSPEWSPDGKFLTLVDSRTGTPNLWSFPLDGSPMKQLTDFKLDGFYNREFSQDGKWIAMAWGTVTSDVILISDYR